MGSTTKINDAIIIANDYQQQELLKVVLDGSGHHAFVCGNFGECKGFLRTDPHIKLVLVVIDPWIEPLAHLLQLRGMLAPLGQLPIIIAIPLSINSVEIEIKLRPYAHVVFGFPMSVNELDWKIKLANRLLQMRSWGVIAEIEHNCPSSIIDGCLHGSEPTSVLFYDAMQHPHPLRTAFVPMLLADYILRSTSPEKPERLDSILTNIFLSDFHTHWLKEEHITRRWLITNFCRFKDAMQQLCDGSEGALKLDLLLASEKFPGKTTVYYSLVPWRLSHKKGGPPMCVAAE